MFRCYSYTIIRERINLCLLKLQSTADTVQHTDTKYGPNTFSHTTTVLTTHRCILMDYFNNCNFYSHSYRPS